MLHVTEKKFGTENLNFNLNFKFKFKISRFSEITYFIPINFPFPKISLQNPFLKKIEVRNFEKKITTMDSYHDRKTGNFLHSYTNK